LIAKNRLYACLLSGLTACLASAQSAVVTPEEHLGRPVGADFELADWNEVSSYFRRLGEASPRVRVETVGRTTEGRDFLLATVSSEANLARIDELRSLAARVADPRGLDAAAREDLLARAKPIVFISIAMHSTETAAPQFGMELAYRLATSDELASVREEVVVLIAPCLNPDGLDEVVSWYRETVGTPYEATGLLRLYQWYAGHDNNRDWFMLSQDETRIVTELLYSTWHPQVYWDVHQQGRSRERFFVPPFRDPLNPNLDPGIIAGIDALGSRALFDMTGEGFSGISTGVTYDMWWNGGNRNVPVRHNVIGLLTEAASVNIASPVFLSIDDLSAPSGVGAYAPSNRFPYPWPGGWWRLRDIIDYEHAFARSLLGSLAREPRRWLENSLAASERALARGAAEAPRAWLVPADNDDRGAVRRLVDTLLLGGVELFVADEDFEADGRRWPAGSLVVPRDQPYGSHVKDLFEVQRYPDGDPPYDVAGWTLPLLLGVRRVELMEAVRAPLTRVRDPESAVAAIAGAGDADALDSRDSDDWKVFIAALAAGSMGAISRTGALAVPAPERAEENGDGDGDGDANPEADVNPDADADANPDDDEWRSLDGLPRVGVYAPWSGVMNEGWLRWVLDEFELPYVRVRNEMLRAGDLAEFLDVLVLPSVGARYLDAGRRAGTVPEEYAGGLDPEGSVAIEEFVRGGGRLVALEESARWAIDLFDLPLVDVARGDTAFSCPGSVLRTTPVPSAWTGGLAPSLPVFFARSSAWREREAEDVPEGARAPREVELDVLLRYAPTRVLLSGWIREPDVIADRAAWIRVAHGDGDVHLFGFRPQYRSWSQAAFQLLFRAILLSGDA
jgi:hypothetical protein